MTGRSHEAREQDDLHTAKEIKENVDVMKVRRTRMDACHGHVSWEKSRGSCQTEGSRRFEKVREDSTRRWLGSHTPWRFRQT